MGRSLIQRIALFRGLGKSLEAPFQSSEMSAVAAQFGVQAQQRFVHLFQIVLQVGHNGLELDQFVFGILVGRHGAGCSC